MLEQPQVAPYLLQRGLIGPQAVVEGDLVVVDISRRNSNFKVITEVGPSYLLKQGVGPERVATIAHEATVYRLLDSAGNGNGNSEMRRYLPRVCLYQPEESILVLELFRDAQNLQEYHLRRGRFSTAIASELGDALGTLHSPAQLASTGVGEGTGDANSQMFARRTPFALSIQRPHLSLFSEISYANLQLVKIVQQFPEFCKLLDDLRGEWTTQAFIHYDIKWSNLLVLPPGRGRERELKIVDWELAGLGDPCWDVGSVFGEYLSFWLSSIPITGEEPPDHFIELARYPLGKMQPALRSFWYAYVRRMGLDAATSYQWLIRAVRYGAARLVQTAFEQSQMSVQLTGNVICSLQLGLNMLDRPQEAAVHLLGIPLWIAEAA